MEFDFKVTIWERVTVDDEKQQERVLQALKDGKINSSNDIYNFLADDGDANVSYDVIPETEEQISLDDNDGYSTIEVIDDDRNTIWCNGVNPYEEG